MGGKDRADKKPTGSLLQRASARGVPPSTVKAAVAIAIVVLVIVIVRWAPTAGGSAFVIESPNAEAEASDVDEGEGEADDGSASSAVAETRKEVCVHVVGAVAAPGVYVLEEGARVADAVELAGGLAPDASDSSVNLARVVVDGEQVYVPTQAEVEAGLAPATGSMVATAVSGGAGALVNINTATSDQLQELPGIGPATATAIITHREENGPFEAKEDIQNVSGIGPGKYAKIESLICV